MIQQIFVDTGAWYALIDRKDPDHQRVASCLTAHTGQLITSSYVFDEALTLLRYRLGWQIAHRFGQRLRDGLLALMMRISSKDEEFAWSVFGNYNDKSFSFTDCTSFALMDRLKIAIAVAIDSDFRAYGLHCIPSLS